VRTHLHREKRMLRIVVDLNPEKDYVVNPTYVASERVFCLEVTVQ